MLFLRFEARNMPNLGPLFWQKIRFAEITMIRSTYERFDIEKRIKPRRNNTISIRNFGQTPPTFFSRKIDMLQSGFFFHR